MSFITRHTNTIIHTQLTQEGKKRLADGDLRIERVAFSDAEVNYSIGRGSGDTYTSYSSTTYSPTLNNIMSAPYRRSGWMSMNYDGTPPYAIDPTDQYSLAETIISPVPSIGFYSAITTATTYNVPLSSYRVNEMLTLATGYTPTRFQYTGASDAPLYRFGFNPNFYRINLSGMTNDPPEEGMVFIQFVTPFGTAPSGHTNIGYYANFYRYKWSAGTDYFELDRAVPRYDGNSIPKQQKMWFYPLSGYSQYYGSGTTSACPIWNMNILSKTPQIGHGDSAFEPEVEYTVGMALPLDIVTKRYGSKSIGGLVKSLGLDHLTKCGIIHYSNSFSGALYGDYLMPRQTIVDMPHILWYRNGSGVNGASTRGGLKLVDSGSDIFYDHTGKTSYTLLKDGSGPSAMAVGRVYFEMKLIVITDAELLTALDPKNNRNWTAPALNLDLVSYADNEIVQLSGYTGIAQPGKRYYLTYHMTSYPGQGARQSVPNAYVQSIDGKLGDDGNPMYIRASFPPNSFPFHRASAGASSGTGAICNTVHLLVQEVDIEDDPGLFYVNQNLWRIPAIALPANSASSWTVNYGVSRYGALGSITPMSATRINSLVLYSTREEYEDYEYFRAQTASDGGPIGQTLGFDRPLWPGDTEFFFGNVTATAVKKNYIRNIHVFLDKSDLNTTTNSTYISGSTYITEVLLLGGDNKILGVGKPDRPLEKNDSILLDMDLRSYY